MKRSTIWVYFFRLGGGGHKKKFSQVVKRNKKKSANSHFCSNDIVQIVHLKLIFFRRLQKGMGLNISLFKIETKTPTALNPKILFFNYKKL